MNSNGVRSAKGLEASGEVVGLEERPEMRAQPVVRLVVVATHGRFLERAVHPFDLTVGPRVVRLREPVLDLEIGAGEFEGMATERLAGVSHAPDVRGLPAAAGRLGEVRAIVGENGVDPIGDRLGKAAQEVCGDETGHPLVQLGEGELAGPVDGHEQVKLAFLGSDLGDVDVEEADGVALNAAFGFDPSTSGNRLISCRCKQR